MYNYTYTTNSMDSMNSGAIAVLLGILGTYAIVCLIIAVISIIADWKVFAKAGKPGWTCLIPIYSSYVFFDILYGNGWKFLLMLIPFYNIYLAIKVQLDLAKVFGQSTPFAIGLIFLNTIFLCILAFGKSEYLGYIAEKNVFVGGAAEKKEAAGESFDDSDKIM